MVLFTLQLQFSPNDINITKTKTGAKLYYEGLYPQADFRSNGLIEWADSESAVESLPTVRIKCLIFDHRLRQATGKLAESHRLMVEQSSGYGP